MQYRMRMLDQRLSNFKEAACQRSTWPETRSRMVLGCCL